MSFIASRLREYYEILGARPRPGCSPSALAAFASTHQLKLPRSVAEFYLALDGLDGEVPEFGLHASQLWPLGELTRVSQRVAQFRGIPDYGLILNTLPDADEYLAFGDAMCWSHVLAVRLTEEAGPVLWISGAAYARVGASFDDFWARYLQSPDSVLWPSQEQIVSPAV